MRQMEATNRTEAADANSRNIFAWCMYDWANSAYSTTVVAGLLPVYFARVVVGSTSEDPQAIGPWGLAVSISAVISFLISPALGAIADFAGAKKKLLLGFAYAGALFTVLLSFCGPGDKYLTLALFIGAQVGFIGANVFYDSFITDIASEAEADRISAKGYSFGYIGGGLQFALALGLIAGRDSLGLSEPSAARIGIVSAGLWWAGFTLITAKYLKEPPPTRDVPAASLRGPKILAYARLGLSRTWSTARHAGRYRHLALFLIAFMLYNDGIQTVIEMASIYGSEQLNLTATVLMTTLLIVQFVAPAGALLFAKLANGIGAKRAIMASLVLWSSVSVLAYFIQTAEQFLGLGVLVGIVLGASQALSRSYYSTMIPHEASAQFFGFFTVFSKFSSIWGPLTFAAIRPPRLAILSLVVLFVAGLVLLGFVDERQARQAREDGRL